jgi:hypothetical protein
MNTFINDLQQLRFNPKEIDEERIGSKHVVLH